MVFVTPYPNLREASCCRVEVVKGAAGVRLVGFTVTSSTVYVALLQLVKKSLAEDCVFTFVGPSALNETVFLFTSNAVKMASIL